MTFQEALERYRKECSGKSEQFLSHSLIGEQLAMAEQIEANRLAIEELRKKLAWKADADCRGHGY